MAQRDNFEPKQNGIVLFQMWEPFRDSLIEEHRFYLDQGKKKLLSQFNEIDKEADEAAERWLESRGLYFNPDRDDPAADFENAYHEGIEYYRLLSEMRDQTRLSLVAGMFHVWDKQLRSWLVKEIHHWHDGDVTLKKVWSANFDEIAGLLDATGLASKDTAYMERLSAYRYVVNVYKHGDGPAFEKLKAKHPEFLRTSLSDEIPSELLWVDFTSLTISEAQLDELSMAITEFWKRMPLEVCFSQVDTVPEWFEKARAKDFANQ